MLLFYKLTVREVNQKLKSMDENMQRENSGETQSVQSVDVRVYAFDLKRFGQDYRKSTPVEEYQKLFPFSRKKRQFF